MINDKLLRVSDAQAMTAMTAGAGPWESTDAIDLAESQLLETLSPEIGQGVQLVCAVNFPTAPTLLTSLMIEIVVAANTGLTTTPVVIGSSGAILLANLTTDAIMIRMNQNAANVDPTSGLHRFLGVRYTVVGTTPGAGAVDANFVHDIQGRQVNYPSRLTVN